MQSKIQGHPSVDCFNGLHCTTGSLGHGLPIGAGMAFARKLKKEGGKIYILIGDGECQEGTTWESLLLASHYKLDNLVILVDYNKIQGSGRVEEVLSLGDLRKKFSAFGSEVIEVENGHSYKEILNAFKKDTEQNKPKIILLHTIKGKGVSYMENKPKWHSKFPNPEELEIAFKEFE